MIDSEDKILIIKVYNCDLLYLQLFPRGVIFVVAKVCIWFQYYSIASSDTIAYN